MEEVEDVERESPKKKHKQTEGRAGIIYLSSVPEYMSVQKLRNVFEEFGEVNRTFFQPVEKSYSYKKGLLFTEGWVEFRKRSVAKLVALSLNNVQVGGKKRNPWYSSIWNIKYLPKFTWTDINADRELKRATYDNRIRADISQVKKQAQFYANSLDKSKTLTEMKKRKEKKGQMFENRKFGDGITQKLTDEEILAQKSKRKHDDAGDAEDKPKRPKKTFGNNDEAASRAYVMSNIFGSAS